MYGKELRVAISAEDLRFIDKFRAIMRDASLSFEKLGEAQLQKELHDFCARGEVLDDGKEGRWFQPFGTSDSLPDCIHFVRTQWPMQRQMQSKMCWPRCI